MWKKSVTGAIVAVVGAAVLVGVQASDQDTGHADTRIRAVDVVDWVDGRPVTQTDTMTRSEVMEAEQGGLVVDEAETFHVSGNISADPYGNTTDSWHLDQMGAAGAWKKTEGSGQVIAVLDTGVAGHEDLAGAVIDSTNLADGTDVGFHGTFVAGLIAARKGNAKGGAGLAPKAGILSVRVCGTSCSSAAIANGIVWAVDHGATVVNMSLAGPGRSESVHTAITYAVDHNVVVVASAGNSATEGNPVMYPAAFPEVISVGATTRGMTRAAFSEYGSTLDVTAPGDEVTSTCPDGYCDGSGTSFAGPLVAAAAALVRAANPTLSPVQVAGVLMSTSADKGSSGRDDQFGSGIVNAAAALSGVGGAIRANYQALSGRVAAAWDPLAGEPDYQVVRDGKVVATTNLTSWDGNATNSVETSIEIKEVGSTRASVPMVLSPRSNLGNNITVSAPNAPSAPSTGPTDDAPGDAPGDMPEDTPQTPGTGLAVLEDATLADGSVRLTVRTDPSVSVGGYQVVRNGRILDSHESVDGYVHLDEDATSYQTSWEVRVLGADLNVVATTGVAVTGSGKPAAPRVPAVSTSQNGTDLNLSWPDLTAAYQVAYQVALDNAAPIAIAGTSATLSIPADGMLHQAKVNGVDEFGQTGAKTQVSVRVKAASRITGTTSSSTVRAGAAVRVSVRVTGGAGVVEMVLGGKKLTQGVTSGQPITLSAKVYQSGVLSVRYLGSASSMGSSSVVGTINVKSVLAGWKSSVSTRAGKTVSANVVVAPGGVRSIKLEQYKGGGWKTVTSLKTSAGGGAMLRWRAQRGTNRLRVVVGSNAAGSGTTSEAMTVRGR